MDSCRSHGLRSSGRIAPKSDRSAFIAGGLYGRDSRGRKSETRPRSTGIAAERYFHVYSERDAEAASAFDRLIE